MTNSEPIGIIEIIFILLTAKLWKDLGVTKYHHPAFQELRY